NVCDLIRQGRTDRLGCRFPNVNQRPYRSIGDLWILQQVLQLRHSDRRVRTQGSETGDAASLNFVRIAQADASQVPLTLLLERPGAHGAVLRLDHPQQDWYGALCSDKLD